VLFSFLLIAASVWDIRKRIIPDSVCILIALTGLIGFSPVNFLGILAALPFLTAALCKPDSIGGGDIKFTAAAGFVIGFWRCVVGLILGLLGLTASLIFYILNQAIRKLKKLEPQRASQASLPMAPFLSLGFLVAAIMNIGGTIL